MKPAKQILIGGMLAVAVMAIAPSARAQVQTTGIPGSPSATTTIDGKQLPPPDPQFGGVIKDTGSQRKPGHYLDCERQAVEKSRCPLRAKREECEFQQRKARPAGSEPRDRVLH
jgi:hypothetical protein